MVFIAAIWWKIAKGREKEFLNKWKDAFTIMGEKRNGLIGEFLSPVDPSDPVDNTWDLVEGEATTFVNIGIWKSKDDFDRAVPQPNRQRAPFEKSDRKRALLAPIMWRIGDIDVRTLAEGVVTIEGTTPHRLPLDWPKEEPGRSAGK